MWAVVVFVLALTLLVPFRTTMCDGSDGVSCGTQCSSLVGVTVACGEGGGVLAVAVGLVAASGVVELGRRRSSVGRDPTAGR